MERVLPFLAVLIGLSTPLVAMEKDDVPLLKEKEKAQSSSSSSSHFSPRKYEEILKDVDAFKEQTSKFVQGIEEADRILSELNAKKTSSATEEKKDDENLFRHVQNIFNFKKNLDKDTIAALKKIESALKLTDSIENILEAKLTKTCCREFLQSALFFTRHECTLFELETLLLHDQKPYEGKPFFTQVNGIKQPCSSLVKTYLQKERSIEHIYAIVDLVFVYKSSALKLISSRGLRKKLRNGYAQRRACINELESSEDQFSAVTDQYLEYLDEEWEKRKNGTYFEANEARYERYASTLDRLKKEFEIGQAYGVYTAQEAAEFWEKACSIAQPCQAKLKRSPEEDGSKDN